MTTLQVIEFVVGFLALLYVWIGAFRLADNWDSLKEWHALGETHWPLWLVAAICLFCWPRTDYANARKEVEKANGKKAQESQLTSNASGGSVASIQKPLRGSRLYDERSLVVPKSRREERMASFYDPYEHAQWYEGDLMAIPGVVGGDDCCSDRRVEDEERTQRPLSLNWGEAYSTPPYLETPTTSPSSSSCGESSRSDSGVGSDYSGSSGSDSSSSGSDSSSGSCGGE